MRPALRWALLATLGLSALAAWWPQDGEDAPQVALPAPGMAARAAAVVGRAQGAALSADAAPAAAAAGALLPRRPAWPALSPAAAAAWQGAAAAAPAVRPAATPASEAVAAPPPFPYPWLGQIEIDGQHQVFLGGSGPLRVASVGDVLDQRWRIDDASPAGLRLTWLPTGEQVLVGRR